jgi:hypothetical protein
MGLQYAVLFAVLYHALFTKEYAPYLVYEKIRQFYHVLYVCKLFRPTLHLR